MHLLTSGGKEADLAKKMLLRLCYYEALDGKEKIEDLRMDSQLYKKLDSQAKGRGNWPQGCLIPYENELTMFKELH